MKEQQPIRIAHVVGKMVGGGVEAFIMNYYRNIDKTKIQFDFIIDSDSKVVPKEEIEKLGGRIIEIPPYQKIFSYIKELKKVLKKNEYKIVHSHLNALSVFPLFSAYLAKVPVRIAHSHSTTNKKEWKKNIIKNILKPFSNVFATDYFACSEHAARWLFGSKAFEKGKVQIIHNAIDVELFKYNEEKRKKIRKELQIENKFVLGHVGRFVQQKNHDFLIDVFEQVYKENNNSVLLLIGDGPLEWQIKQKVKKLNLESAVYFLGIRENVNELMQAMDVFVFPSLYEGLGIVLIEAQISGLKCVVSKNIPNEARITDFFCNVSTEDLNIWKTKILEENNKRNIDENKSTQISMYNIKQEVYRLEDVYKNLTSDITTIELFGLPGCGKSTISNRKYYNFLNYNEKYIYNDNRIIRNMKKMINIFEVIIFNNQFYRKSLIFIKNVNSLKLKLKMLLYINCSINISIKANKKIKNVILEEGMLQALWAICYNSCDYDDDIINEFLDSFKELFMKKIIFVDTDLKIIKERLQKRNSCGGSELENEIDKNENALNKAEKIKKDILRILNEKNIYVEILKGNKTLN